MMVGAVPDPVLAPLYRLDSRWRLSSYLPFDTALNSDFEALLHHIPSRARGTAGGTLVSGFMGTAWTGTLRQSRVSYPLFSPDSYTQFSVSMWCYVASSIDRGNTPRLASIRSNFDTFLEVFVKPDLSDFYIGATSTLMNPTTLLHSDRRVAFDTWCHVVLSLLMTEPVLQLSVNGAGVARVLTDKVFPRVPQAYQFLSLGNSVADPSPFTGNPREFS